jgi:hypothetical protein
VGRAIRTIHYPSTVSHDAATYSGVTNHEKEERQFVPILLGVGSLLICVCPVSSSTREVTAMRRGAHHGGTLIHRTVQLIIESSVAKARSCFSRPTSFNATVCIVRSLFYFTQPELILPTNQLPHCFGVDLTHVTTASWTAILMRTIEDWKCESCWPSPLDIPPMLCFLHHGQFQLTECLAAPLLYTIMHSSTLRIRIHVKSL